MLSVRIADIDRFGDPSVPRDTLDLVDVRQQRISYEFDWTAIQLLETIAEESIYDEHADDVAEVLGNAHEMAQADEAVTDLRDSVSAARQELFPELADDIVLDIEEDPFADADTAEESIDEPGDGDITAPSEGEEVVEQ